MKKVTFAVQNRSAELQKDLNLLASHLTILEISADIFDWSNVKDRLDEFDGKDISYPKNSDSARMVKAYYQDGKEYDGYSYVQFLNRNGEIATGGRVALNTLLTRIKEGKPIVKFQLSNEE